MSPSQPSDVRKRQTHPCTAPVVDGLGLLLVPSPAFAYQHFARKFSSPRFAVPEGSIHRSITFHHHRVLDERWVLSNIDTHEIARGFSLGLHPGVPIESIRRSGEKWNSSMKSVIAPS